jgi:hypothetical protein
MENIIKHNSLGSVYPKDLYEQEIFKPTSGLVSG